MWSPSEGGASSSLADARHATRRRRFCGSAEALRVHPGLEDGRERKVPRLGSMQNIRSSIR
eukprot:6560964-Heterocapsa_arctica.AAC.1